MSGELSKDGSVLVCGCGVFGIATAYGLANAGYKDVTVIDRGNELPAMDAASTDINKVCRSEYADAINHELAFEAIQEFKTEKWKDVYYHAGNMLFGKENEKYFQDICKNITSRNIKGSAILKRPEDAIEYPEWAGRMPVFPEGTMASANPEGGWAASGTAVERMMQWFTDLGGKIVPGQVVDDFIYAPNENRVRGVKTKGGNEFHADLVVLAAGAWTESLLQKSRFALNPGYLTASAHCIAAVKLNDELWEKHKNNPVLTSSSNGYYMFPPTPDAHVVKFVFHSAGYINVKEGSTVSIPRTKFSEGGEDGAIPLSDQKQLRAELAKYYPDLAQLPFEFTRVCWYTDSPDSNFLIDFHPDMKGLFFATAGSGHGFKFFSVLPKYILQRLEGTLAPHLAKKWAFEREVTSAGDGPRLTRSRGDFRKADWEKAQDWTKFDAATAVFT